MDIRQHLPKEEKEAALPSTKKRFTSEDAYKSYREGYMLSTFDTLFSLHGTLSHVPPHPSQLFPKKPAPKRGDRFIPERITDPVELDIQQAKLNGLFDGRPSRDQSTICEELLNTPYASIQKASIFNLNIPTYHSPTHTIASKRQRVPYQIKPVKALDGPGFINDFYINPLCWGEQRSIYIGLYDNLYHYNFSLSATQKIQRIPNSYITALAYQSQILIEASTSYLDDSHQISLIDAETHSNINTLQVASKSRVITPDAENNFYIIGKSRGLGSELIHYDTRTQHPTIIPFFDQNLVGLSFSEGKGQLAINAVEEGTMLFDQRCLTQPMWQYNGHSSSNSKAIAFSPSGQYLATGGGTADKKITIWDTLNGKDMAQANADAQVCNIHWISSDSLFVTRGHGRPSVSCWFFHEPSLSLDTQVSHEDRVLFSAQNPANRTELATGSADETVMLWSMFKPKSNGRTGTPSSKASSSSAKDLPYIMRLR